MREFFYIHRSDRRVIIALLCVIIVVLAVIMLTGGEQTAATSSAADSTSRKDYMMSRYGEHSLYGEHNRYGERNRRYDDRPIDDGTPAQQVRLFPFDPNTADSTQLLQLGLQRWQVRNIYRYRRAGGIYRRPQDFARLYGLTAGQYRQLEPYIRISADYQPASNLYPSSNNPKLPPPKKG